MSLKPRPKSHAPAMRSRKVTDDTALANLFRERRLAAGFDVAGLAAHAGVSVAVVTMLDTNPSAARLHDLYAVANVLNLDPGIVVELLHAAAR